MTSRAFKCGLLGMISCVDENEQMDTLNRIPVDQLLFLYYWDLNDIGALSSKRMYIVYSARFLIALCGNV